MIFNKARVFTPETEVNETDAEWKNSVFLAGTIEMGNSIDWQANAVQRLKDLPVNIFNPRRIVPPNEDLIAEQINWELDSIARSDFIFMHLVAGSVSPISLYELGLLQGNNQIGKKGKTIVVACDPLYTRKANVIVTLAHKYFGNEDIYFTHSFEGGIIEIRKRINSCLQYQNF